MAKNNKLKKFFNSKVGSWFNIVVSVLFSVFAQVVTYAYAFHYDGHICDFYYCFVLVNLYFSIEFTVWAVQTIVRHVKKYGKKERTK